MRSIPPSHTQCCYHIRLGLCVNYILGIFHEETDRSRIARRALSTVADEGEHRVLKSPKQLIIQTIEEDNTGDKVSVYLPNVSKALFTMSPM